MLRENIERIQSAGSKQAQEPVADAFLGSDNLVKLLRIAGILIQPFAQGHHFLLCNLSALRKLNPCILAASPRYMELSRARPGGDNDPLIGSSRLG